MWHRPEGALTLSAAYFLTRNRMVRMVGLRYACMCVCVRNGMVKMVGLCCMCMCIYTNISLYTQVRDGEDGGAARRPRRAHTPRRP
jgi:hypothetical protein